MVLPRALDHAYPPKDVSAPKPQFSVVSKRPQLPLVVQSPNAYMEAALSGYDHRDNFYSRLPVNKPVTH